MYQLIKKQHIKLYSFFTIGTFSKSLEPNSRNLIETEIVIITNANKQETTEHFQKIVTGKLTLNGLASRRIEA
jgi:ABC-type molybdate transport system substrate-binding protein